MNRHVVYFVGAKNGLMKIGRTSNMPKRLRDLNNISPVLIGLFHVINCASALDTKVLEKEFHKRFQSRNHHGEWFKLSKADKKEIKKFDESEEIDMPYRDLKRMSLICPDCGKTVKGKRGLLSHSNFCPKIEGELR